MTQTKPVPRDHISDVDKQKRFENSTSLLSKHATNKIYCDTRPQHKHPMINSNNDFTTAVEYRNGAWPAFVYDIGCT